MAEKRKHEDAESEIVKSKKFKKTQKYHTKFKKQERKSKGTENTENSAIVSTKNEKIKSKQPKTSQSVLKVSDENKDNKNKAQNKSGKKSKKWKPWERRKKQQKIKEINKKETGDLKSSQTSKESVKKQSPKVMEKTLDTKLVSSNNKPTEPVSCNWKKLKMDLKKTKPRKHFKKKSLKKSGQAKTEKKEEESVEPEIWFDDVDEELLKPKKDIQGNKQASRKQVSRAAKSADGLVKEHAYKGLTKAVALDCEMVGVGDGGKESVLARVSVVNQYGECLYDTFVRSREDVVDYRTQWSGVTPEKLENASDFLDAQKHVSDLLRGRILVGHAVHHDLKVLFLNHPHKDIRDTSHYKPYKQMFKGRTPSLKNLTSRLLDVKIQTGEHNSVTDAQAAMRLYTFSRKEWEGHLKKRRIRKPKTPAKEKAKN